MKNVDRQPLSRLISNPLYFPWWWYVENLSFWYRFMPRTIILFIDLFSFIDVLRVFFKPFRRDFTWVGYAMGIFFRTVWLLVSAVFILLVTVVTVAVFFLYLLLPVSFILFFLSPGIYRILGVIGPLLTAYGYYIGHVRKPTRPLKEAGTWAELQLAFLPPVDKVVEKLSLRGYSPLVFWRAFLKSPRADQFLLRLGLNSEREIEKLTKGFSEIEGTVDDWKKLFWAAKVLGKQLGRNHLSCELLFLAWVKEEKEVEKVFNRLNLEWLQLREVSQWMYARELRASSWKYWEDRFFRRRPGVDVGWVAGWMRHLKHFSVNITDLVKQGKVPYLIGRENVLQNILAALEQTTRNNVLLIGSPGVGKTTVAYGVAEKILTGEVGPKLLHKKLIRLDLAGLLSGSGRRGEMERRVHEALKEVVWGQAILFIDEIHSLVGAGGESGSTDIASFVAPALSAGQIQLIATTTPEDYRQYIEGNPTFASYFQVVRLEEPTKEETIRILEWFVPQMEADQGIRVTMPAISEAVDLTSRYIHDRYLPGKAVELLDTTSVMVQKEGRVEVTAEDVARVLSGKVGIPLEQMTREEKELLLKLEGKLHERVIDQEKAIELVSNALRRARSGLSPEDRPIASFLFVGPTGVGKTETAKALSDIYFGSEERMIRVDMSEYSQPNQIDRLIGSPPGHAGHEQGGYLTEAVRSQPFAVVLLDEVEKAHPEVHNLLLQVMDDGRLTDGKGRTVNFTNSMIICTSNAFSLLIQESLKKGLSMEEIESLLKDRLLEVFRPELLNRFDSVVVFRTLKPEHVKAIAGLMLGKVKKKMKAKKIELSFTPEVVERLAKLGFDPQFGARPLRRVIQSKVEDSLAEMILSGKLERGSVHTFTLNDLK